MTNQSQSSFNRQVFTKNLVSIWPEFNCKWFSLNSTSVDYVAGGNGAKCPPVVTAPSCSPYIWSKCKFKVYYCKMYALFTMYCSWQNSAYKSLPSIIHLSFEYSCCCFEKEHMVGKYLFTCHCWFWQLQQRIAAVGIEYFNPTGTNYVLRLVTYLF